jgi:mono/diheme cytochrome c family protein
LRKHAAALLAALALLASCGGDDDEPAPAPRGGDPGLRVWAAQGCGSCHTFKAAGATGVVGPNLDETLKGHNEDYIRESIVAPSAVVAGGGETLMPIDYARRIREPDLDALVEFIARGAR